MARAALADRQWEDARALAALAIEANVEVEAAKQIMQRAVAETNNRVRLEQGEALFAADQFIKAYVKVDSIDADSAYGSRADNLSMRIRQAAALPEVVERETGEKMSRILVGNFPRGSSAKEIERTFEVCEKSGDCEMKWFESEGPERRITLGSYFIDRHEVSVSQYSACVAKGGCKAIDWETCGAGLNVEGSPFAAAASPQSCVSWSEAVTFCEWAGGRLPTEAEWERAATGPDDTRFPWGATWNDREANWGDGGASDGYESLAPVGSFGSNAEGLFDMAGNVYEWTADWYDPNAYGDSPKLDPRGPDAGTSKVIRGGDFTRDQGSMRGAHRNRANPEVRDKTVGFRCAKSPSQLGKVSVAHAPK